MSTRSLTTAGALVGHVSPDWDCITALWLLRRFAGFAGAEIVLVNAGNPDFGILHEAVAVVDTGSHWDPVEWRFDHHQLPLPQGAETCAAMMVADWLREIEDVGWALPTRLDPLLALVQAGDVGDPSARPSRERGMHALLSEWKRQRVADEELLQRGFALLDEIDGLLGPHDLDTAIAAAVAPYAADLAAYAEHAAQARAAIDQHIVYRSRDGMLVALDGAPQAASQAAFEQGARLVLFRSDYPDVPTVAVGCARSAEWQTPHIGHLAAGVREGLLRDVASGDLGVWGPSQGVAEEIARWFLHPAGFFAGRGTPKAPDATPLGAALADIAAALDGAWQR